MSGGAESLMQKGKAREHAGKQAKKRNESEDARTRVEFLATASRSATVAGLTDLAQYLGEEARYTAQKTKVRTKPDRYVCKKCASILVQGINAHVTVTRAALVLRCHLCSTVMRVLLRKLNRHHGRFGDPALVVPA